MGSRTFDLRLLGAPFMWLELNHLYLLHVNVTHGYVLEMMCHNYPCVAKLVIRLLLRGEQLDALGHLPVLLPHDVLLQALKPFLELQVLSVIKDLYFLDLFHEGLYPKLHILL